MLLPLSLSQWPQSCQAWGRPILIKLTLRTEMVVKTRPNFQRRGLAVGNPRYKSNKELTLLITNNSQD